MPKATIQRMQDEGWRADQFGGGFPVPADFEAYLQRVIDEAGRWAASKIGQVQYDAVVVPSYINDCIVRAEVCAAQSALWKRRAAFLDAGAANNRESPAYLERREYLAHAAAAWQCAIDSLTEAMDGIGIVPVALGDWTGFASGVVESGRYPIAPALVYG